MSLTDSITMRLVCLLLCAAAGRLTGQPRSMAQDTTLNNLVHAPGTRTTPLGSLGAMVRRGDGAVPMLLLPGIGFGAAETWGEFMDRHLSEYTMYAVTLPGFGGTAPYPLVAGERASDRSWLQAGALGLKRLVDSLDLRGMVIMAHWGVGTDLAVRLAREVPERVASVILVAGVRRVVYEGVKEMPAWGLSERARYVEGMAQRWFRTVTRRTWDDNNYMSYDYAINPRRGLFLWREAQSPTLATWVRYLLEWYANDATIDLQQVKAPVLVLQPGFDDAGYYTEPGGNYMRNLTQDSWLGFQPSPGRVEVERIGSARLFLMHDQPGELDRRLRSFLARHSSRPQ